MSSDLQKEMNSKANILKAIQKISPDYRCVYFPMEGKFLSFVKHKELTGKMFNDEGDCLLEAWEIIVNEA